MSELYILIWSAIGGSITTMAIIAITQLYWQQSIKQYDISDSLLEQHIAIKELEDDVITLRMQVIALQAHINE